MIAAADIAGGESLKRALIPVGAALVLCLLAGSRAAAGPVVLFDEGHRQQFLAGRGGELDLSGLAALFRQAGLEVRTNNGRLDAGALEGVSALVISGPFAPLAPEEAEAILTFVEAGGRLALMLHIGQPLQVLLERLGIQYSRGPIHEAEAVIGGRDLDFAVTRFRPHAITDGLGGLGVFGCWALKNFDPEASEIARTSARAWLDSDGNGRLSPGEPVGEHALIVAGALARGEYVVFGDDAIFQNRFLEPRNRDLGRRLARWLAAGPRDAPPPARTHPGGIRL
jgi:hypothetical protein